MNDGCKPCAVMGMPGSRLNRSSGRKGAVGRASLEAGPGKTSPSEIWRGRWNVGIIRSPVGAIVLPDPFSPAATDERQNTHHVAGPVPSPPATAFPVTSPDEAARGETHLTAVVVL